MKRLSKGTGSYKTSWFRGKWNVSIKMGVSLRNKLVVNSKLIKRVLNMYGGAALLGIECAKQLC